MATEKVKVVNIDTQPATKSVKELRKELKELKDQLLSTEEGTQQYNDILQQAAGIQHTLKEQMEEVNASAMDFGQIVGNVVKATGGLVAGFQAAQATMNLFGVENENVIKAMQKMQSLMAITQAIPAIDDGIKGFKRLGLAIKGASLGMSTFKKALISTGIGAAVVAVGALVANWDKLTEALSKWGILHKSTSEKLEEEAEKAKELKEQIKEAHQAVEDWEKEQKVGNLSSAAKEEYDNLGKELDGIQLKLKELDVEWSTASKKRFEELHAQAEVLWEQESAIKRRRAEILKDTSLTKEAEEERKKAEEERKKAEEERKKRLEEERRVLEDLRKKYGELSEDIALFGATDYQKRINELEKSEQKSIEIVESALKKGIVNTEQAEKDKASIRKHYQNLREESAREEASIEREKTLEMMDISYSISQAKLQKQYDEKLISEQDFNDRKKELLETYVQDYVESIQFMLDTESSLTDEQILELTTKINDARSLLKEEPKEETKSKEETTAERISEAINASALALTDFSDNPAWGNILRNVATLTANWDTLSENMKKINSDIPEEANKAYSAYAQIAATALSAVAQMMNGLAAEQDQSNKEGFESAKKYQIAGATMSMLAGIASAWASSMQLVFPANVIVGSLLSAMMLGTGIAQIAKIKKQQFNGGGSTGGSSSPNAGAVSSVIAPVQYTQDVQGASIEGAIKDTKVYVTETDITNTQNKVSVTENEAIY